MSNHRVTFGVLAGYLAGVIVCGVAALAWWLRDEGLL